MSYWHEHWGELVFLVWLIVAIGFYFHLLWMDESKLSPDTRTPEEWKPIMAAFWFILIPMRIITKAIDLGQWLWGWVYLLFHKKNIE
jgi:hypothetical protein